MGAREVTVAAVDGPFDCRVPHAGRRHQRSDLRAARARAGARIHRHADHLDSVR